MAAAAGAAAAAAGGGGGTPPPIPALAIWVHGFQPTLIAAATAVALVDYCDVSVATFGTMPGLYSTSKILTYPTNIAFDEVVNMVRTKLTDSLTPDDLASAHIHAHSMGGLVMAAALPIDRPPTWFFTYDTPWGGLTPETARLVLSGVLPSGETSPPGAAVAAGLGAAVTAPIGVGKMALKLVGDELVAAGESESFFEALGHSLAAGLASGVSVLAIGALVRHAPLIAQGMAVGATAFVKRAEKFLSPVLPPKAKRELLAYRYLELCRRYKGTHSFHMRFPCSNLDSGFFLPPPAHFPSMHIPFSIDATVASREFAIHVLDHMAMFEEPMRSRLMDYVRNAVNTEDMTKAQLFPSDRQTLIEAMYAFGST